MDGNRGRDHPRGVRQLRTIPQSRPLVVPAPFAQGSLGSAGRCSVDRRRQLTGGSGAERSDRARPSSCCRSALRRRSRLAARRIAGSSVRSRQLDGDLRPLSNVLGKVQEGTGVPSWFPPLAERFKSFFPATCVAGKIPRMERRVKNARSHRDWAFSAPKRSAMPPPASPEGALVIVPPPKGRRHGAFPRPNVPRYIWVKFFIDLIDGNLLISPRKCL